MVTSERALKTRALTAGGKLAAVLGALILLAATGLVGALDDALVRAYYKARGRRASAQKVVLVGIDDDTISRWGAPPYPAEQLAPLLAAVGRDQPRVVAAADPRWRLVRGEPPAGAGLLVADGRSAPAFDAQGGLGATAVWLTRDGAPTVTRLVLEAAGVPAARDRLPVNYLGAEGLPVLPAHRVARGELPAGTFSGKIVLLGVVARDEATVVTPVGLLAPAEIQAHALLGATDGAAWAVLPRALGWLLTVLLAGALIVLTQRFDEMRALGVAAGAVAGCLLVDYTCFAAGWLVVGAGAPLVTIVLVPLVQGFTERRLLRQRLHEIQRDIRLRAELHSLRGDPGEDERRFWTRVAELARLYIDCRSSIVAELPADRWHLSLRVITGATVGEIREKRRDVRRGSFRKAHLTLNPVWQDDFMSRKRGEKTLLTPLVSGTTLVGFWILNFPADAYLDPPHLKLITSLARQIALAIVARRQRGVAPPGELLERLLSEGVLAGEVAGIAHALKEVGGDKKQLSGLIDTTPSGLCVATLWGELRYANAAMRTIADEEGLPPLGECSVADVLLALTPLGKDEVDDTLRKVVRESPEMQVAGRPGAGRRAKYQLVLAWLPEEEDREKLLLVSVIPTRLATRAVRASDFLDEGTTQLRTDLDPATTTFDKGDGTVPFERTELPRPRDVPNQPSEAGELTEEIRGLVDSLHDTETSGPGHVTLPQK